MRTLRTLAVDVGGTNFSIAWFIGSDLMDCERMATDRDGGPSWMMKRISEIWARWSAQGIAVDRCGVGFGGPVDFRSQTVTMSTHVGGWSGYPLVQELSALTGAKAMMDNDANVGALGEFTYGAGAGFDPLLYVTVSTGIGGGIIINGQIFRGADSYAGELGHLNVDPEGPVCLCGSNGCLERMCCGLWLERDFGKSAKDLLSDPEFARSYSVRLARGLKAAIMVLNPARVVIGGGISNAGDRLFDPLRAELDRQITSWSRARKDVVPAKLGDRSVLYGAVALANQSI